MELWQALNGTVTVEYMSADCPAALSALQEIGIIFENVQYIDELTIRFRVRRQDMHQIKRYAVRKSDQCKVLGRQGLFWKLQSCVKRPVLMVGFSTLILLTLFLPTRILFYRVEGNTTVATNKILEFVSQNGIPFGAVRREIRSEKVKNALLQELPELEWAGVNTAGCVVTISVRERQNTNPAPEKKGVSSIVADRDGVVQMLTATSGSPAVKPGQAVKEGQLLISGYTDCGISVRAERAAGEVYAATNRNITCILPENATERGAIRSETKKYSLIIGKKRINFSKDSGNSDMVCAKIYEENYLTLPGGFQLPVAIVTERSITYDLNISPISQTCAENSLLHFSQRQLEGQMIAGRILSKQEMFSKTDGLYMLCGEYACLEMIGKERNEEIIKP